MMDGTRLITELNRGFKKIDAMKSEIANTMGVLLSIISAHGKLSFDLMIRKNKIVVTDNFKWEFFERSTEIFVQCYEILDQGKLVLIYDHCSSVPHRFHQIEKVAKTHKATGELVSYLMEDAVVRGFLNIFIEAGQS